jgi:putative membrane protein
MEKRVYGIICNPAMMITWTFGLLMIYVYGFDWFRFNHWLHVKLVLLVLMTLYHLYCKSLIKKLENTKTGFTSTQFRLFNEIPTVFLILIVSIAVYKNATNPLILIASIVGVGVFLVIMTKLYKKIRESNP